ncbi:MAG TPA: 3-hydroxyacyl-[acyl-carrier-protein] dehydratase FabZ [Candidatus Binatia bacterium]|nr:3-hydroxyacyl-[acyl-carrier-protein] dehydratase FabZ [Candidatus Binatia bacterium]
MTLPRDPVPRLPHAVPFLLIDRVLEIEEQRGAFVKLVTATDPCVAPDGTLPGAFVLEAMAQGGGALLGALADRLPPAGYLAGIDDFRLLGPVRVGDLLRVEVSVVRQFATATLLQGRALVGEEVRAEARFTLAVPR